MEKVFLDTNTFIDINERRDPKLEDSLINCGLYVSVISIGIWAYIYKQNVPGANFNSLFNVFNVVDATSAEAVRSSQGPTNDFEDNMQLHAAVDSECSVFLTKDSNLLKLGNFGKVRISDTVYLHP